MPLTVTWYSCIASSRAACVLGGVRLISSARMMLAKIGPRMKRITRFPEFLDQERLGQPRNAAQQAVPSGEKRDQDLANHAFLSDDRFRQLAFEPPGHLGHAIDRHPIEG